MACVLKVKPTSRFATLEASLNEKVLGQIGS
jgi:hypothetical protein